MQVDEAEDTDFGGGYSDQSSHAMRVLLHPIHPLLLKSRRNMKELFLLVSKK